MRYIKSYANDAAIQEAVDNKSLGKPYVALNDATGEIDFNTKEETDYSKMYFTFEALENGSFWFRNWEHSTKPYSYSVNNGEWVLTSDLVATVNLNIGDTVRFKSNDAPTGLFDNISRNFNVYGNILSLKYGDNFANIKNDSYKLTFLGSTVVDASNLILPATTLENGCYDSMFKNCKSLIKAPALPATTLANYCYSGMFRGCTSLNYIKCLATNISASNCLTNWLNGVSPTGTFVKKAGVTWPTGDSGIPSGWTVIEE